MDLSKIMLIVRWLLTKGDILQPVIVLWERAREAATISAWVAVLAELCGLLEDELEDFPNLDVFMGPEDAEEGMKACKAEAAERGLNIVMLVQIAKMLYEIWKQFKDREQE